MEDQRITERMPYGRHIPLIDKNGKKAHTKNISGIGARSIFASDIGDWDKIDIDSLKVDDAAIDEELRITK